jgi:hypothetical protein
MQYIITKSELARRDAKELAALRTMFKLAIAASQPCTEQRRKLIAAVDDIQEVLRKRGS